MKSRTALCFNLFSFVLFAFALVSTIFFANQPVHARMRATILPGPPRLRSHPERRLPNRMPIRIRSGKMTFTGVIAKEVR